MELNYLHLDRPMRVLVVDNYDSFTFNCVQVLQSQGARVDVVLNDDPMAAVLAETAEAIVLSPGPGTPDDSGVCRELVRAFWGRKKILGLCLGHQVIAKHLGAAIARSGRPLHGVPCRIRHTAAGLFEGLPNPLVCARYNSLAVVESTLPPNVVVTAKCEHGEVMAIESDGLAGFQFHPESVLSEYGPRLMFNWLRSSAHVDASRAAVKAQGLYLEPK
jgi:anthranilate synthase/aminodeoxychorismate synthase-like glutamine amidotransferase